MTPQLTFEMRAGLAAPPGVPIEVEQTQRVHLLVEVEHARSLVDQRIREPLAVADADIAARRIVAWGQEGLRDRAGLRSPAVP